MKPTYRDFSFVFAGGLVVVAVLIAFRTWQLGTGGGFGYVLAALFAAAGLGRIYVLRR
jgi:hypothetical protein